MDKVLELSIVIPVYDEEDNVLPLYESLIPVLESLEIPWEIVYVDDGSKDNTLVVLTQIAARDSRVCVVALRRNYGQTAAMAAGIDHAQGEVIVFMDGDMQNSPADIPRMLAKLDEGYDVVSGWRKHRRDPLITKRIPSLLANKLASLFTGLSLHDFGCTQKAYRREVLQGIKLYGELHRFMPALAASVGAQVAELEVAHFPRTRGKTKYGVSRMIRGILDLITLRLILNYMSQPMQMFGGLGLIMAMVAALSGTATLAMKGLLGTDITGNPLLYLTMLAIIACIQLISLGFLGEINIRTYHETQHKPIYLVRGTFGGNGTGATWNTKTKVSS